MSEQDYKISYQDEWVLLFSSSRYLQKLQESAIKGHLKYTRVRSVCWKLFLGCLPENKKDWIDMTKSQRRQYDEILDKFHTNPRDVDTLDINVNNPLSQSHQSPWNQYFQDHELKITIQQDVVRTFPEIEFFRATDIQNMMVNILFNYAREFPHIAYKQGMHELLAPILYVLYLDQKSYLRASETSDLDMEIHILLNQNYLEHDAFTLFCRLMSRVEAWYTTDSPYSEDASGFSEEPPKKFSLVCFLSLPDTLKCISTGHLKRIDNELFCHLEKLEITPQIYGIRWLRLLFGREFSVNELLVLWDAIFADSVDFLLVDYIFVAMLNSIRGLLLEGDYASCLNCLMRFPHVEDVQYIIDLALHLRDPHKCKRPEGGPRVHRLSKNTKLTGIKSLPKTSAGSVKTLTISRESLEIRPKSLSIAGVNKLWSNAAELSPPDSRSKSSSLSEGHSNVKPIIESEPDLSSDFLSMSISPSLSITASSTLPRTSIRNVMESKSHKFRATDLSQMVGHESILSEKASREMVPLIPPTSSAACNIVKEFKHPPKDIAENIQALKTEVSNLKSMNEHCVHLLNHHLNTLQECLMNQKLKNEDVLFISLAGLKRARNILNGAVNFTDEAIDDELSMYLATQRGKPKHSMHAPLYKQDLSSKGDDSEYKDKSIVSSVTSIVAESSGRKEEKHSDSSSPELLDMYQDVISFPTKENF